MIIRAADTLAEAGAPPPSRGSTRCPTTAGRERIDKQATNHWNDESHATRLKEAGVEIVRGHGRLDGPAGSPSTGRRTSRRVAFSSTPAPRRPCRRSTAGLETHWTNREVMRLTELPASLAVIGGRAIGAELAQAFARFGVRVTVVEVLERILGPEEPPSRRS